MRNLALFTGCTYREFANPRGLIYYELLRLLGGGDGLSVFR